MSERPIGIFDSGIGGLTVCRAINEILPRENLIYFGDTARFPTGRVPLRPSSGIPGKFRPTFCRGR
jgi:glutamate racemase